MILSTVVLPPALAAAIPSIRWPLKASSCPPLYFESLETLKGIRKTPPPLDLLQDLPSTVDSLFPPSDNAEKRHFGFLATALILIGNGFTDECHNLITPLSWPDDIHFAHGPSIYSQVSSETRAYASYVHCLVHRREAFNVGEFGMVGFANANYWSNAVAKSPGAHLLPHARILSEVRSLASQNVDSQAWADEYLTDDSFFESRAVHELCARVLRGQDDEQLREFTEHVAEIEVRVLLGNVLQKAGFDIGIEYVLRKVGAVDASESIASSRSSKQVDEAVALTAARKVSAAHLSNFRSSGTITLRQVMNEGDDAMSAAAGVSCRLMNSQACRLLNEATETVDTRHQVLQVALATSEAEAQSLNKNLVNLGDSLSPFDLVAIVSSVESLRKEDIWLNFVPSLASESALFVDQLFGTCGETPTTVVQWSKGTIF